MRKNVAFVLCVVLIIFACVACATEGDLESESIPNDDWVLDMDSAKEALGISFDDYNTVMKNMLEYSAAQQTGTGDEAGALEVYFAEEKQKLLNASEEEMKERYLRDAAVVHAAEQTGFDFYSMFPEDEISVPEMTLDVDNEQDVAYDEKIGQEAEKKGYSKKDYILKKVVPVYRVQYSEIILYDDFYENIYDGSFVKGSEDGKDGMQFYMEYVQYVDSLAESYRA